MTHTIADAAFAATQAPDHRAMLLNELLSQQERSMALAGAHLDDARLALDKIKHFLRTDNEV
jgi:hypothetical protein